LPLMKVYGIMIQTQTVDESTEDVTVNKPCLVLIIYMQGGVVMDTESTTTKNAEKSLIIARNNLNHMYPSSTVSPLF